jgi:hypothetical protein
MDLTSAPGGQMSGSSAVTATTETDALSPPSLVSGSYYVPGGEP